MLIFHGLQPARKWDKYTMPAFGAVFLPFFAVVAANAVAPRVRGRVQPVLPVTDDTLLLTRAPDSPTDR